MFVSAGHVHAALLDQGTCVQFFFLSCVRKQVVIIMTLMVGTAFWHREARRQKATLMLKK